MAPLGRVAAGGGADEGGMEAKCREVIRPVQAAHLRGNAPQASVETGRKMAPDAPMPSFQEPEAAVRDLKIA